MTTEPMECIHGLIEGTCSICSGREARDAEARQTLRGMIREEWERRPDADRVTIVRIVIGHVLARPDAADLLMPAALALMTGIERGPVHRAEVTALRSLERFQSQPETSDATWPNLPTSPAAHPPEQASEATRPSVVTPARDLLPVPNGMTMAQYAKERREALQASSRAWLEHFVRSSFMNKPVTINRQRVLWKNVTMEQAQARLAFLERQASGTAQSITFVQQYLNFLDVTGVKSAGEFLKKLDAPKRKQLGA